MNSGGGAAPARRRGWRVARRALVPLLFGVCPVIAYVVLVRELAAAGAAGVMLGAVSGTPFEAIAATVVAIALRIYVVVLLPGLCAYKLVAWLLLATAKRAGAGPPPRP